MRRSRSVEFIRGEKHRRIREGSVRLKRPSPAAVEIYKTPASLQGRKENERLRTEIHDLSSASFINNVIGYSPKALKCCSIEQRGATRQARSEEQVKNSARASHRTLGASGRKEADSRGC